MDRGALDPLVDLVREREIAEATERWNRWCRFLERFTRFSIALAIVTSTFALALTIFHR